MNKKRIIYTGLLILVAVIVSIASFSYAYLTKVDEQHGKINVVVGTLDYKIESDDLENNSITLSANESKEIEITIKSLNKIDSKYQLYTNNVENVDIRYTDEEEPGVGTIESNGTKKVKVVLENNSDTDKTITFGVQGGFEDKTLTLEDNRVAVVLGEGLCIPGTIYNFDYTGDVQTFEAKCHGTYKLEAWGAQGGGNGTYIGGYGAYSTGSTFLEKNDTLYVIVGEGGRWSTTDYEILPTTYNGGGGATEQWSSGALPEYHSSGGGATHIAKVSGTLSSIGYESFVTNNNGYIVAAGGGGAGYFSNNSANSVTIYGGHGGGIEGVIGNTTIVGSTFIPYVNSQPNTPATQTSSSVLYYGNDSPRSGSFGQGGTSYLGGGSGLYGGAGIHGRSTGGSSYIGNPNLTNKKMYCYNCTENSDLNTYTVSTYGTTTHTSERDTTNCPNGYSNDPVAKCAKAGNGYARITYLGTRTVTFNANGGEISETSRKVNYGYEVGELPTPTKGGKTFLGWYTDINYTTKVDSTYKVEDDITLYAAWGTEINMNLSNRTQGYPSNTTYANTTKRIFDINTYVVGLANSNQYDASSITSYSIGNNNISFNIISSRSGYGIGIPMNIASGKFILQYDLNVQDNSGISVVSYKNDGTMINYELIVTSGKVFDLPNNTSYFVLVPYARQIVTTTFSNIKLYKLD